ncbi:hypothetical protein PLESTB_001101600 [Pleodorina starrii]|uniref:Uncharacterized protein n=1 Tax=Pleodorina starrii TaxID=330485 RepID=A0A9W6BQP6_9CHLO|nr:hypothetical protein PLESTB_001101600 [Pleodorina starrii]
MQSHVVARPRPGVAPSNAKHVVLRALPVTARSRSAWHSRGNLLTCSSSAASPSAPGGDPANSNLPPDTSTSPNTSPGLLGRIKRFFLGDKLDKEKLAQLGMGAFASYGFISNVTYGICLGTAWISFVKATGKSPLAAGQWPAFLGFYAGLWTVQNFVRPLRFSLAIALAPGL